MDTSYFLVEEGFDPRPVSPMWSFLFCLFSLTFTECRLPGVFSEGTCGENSLIEPVEWPEHFRSPWICGVTGGIQHAVFPWDTRPELPDLPFKEKSAAEEQQLRKAKFGKFHWRHRLHFEGVVSPKPETTLNLAIWRFWCWSPEELRELQVEKKTLQAECNLRHRKWRNGSHLMGLPKRSGRIITSGFLGLQSLALNDRINWHWMWRIWSFWSRTSVVSGERRGRFENRGSTSYREFPNHMSEHYSGTGWVWQENERLRQHVKSFQRDVNEILAWPCIAICDEWVIALRCVELVFLQRQEIDHGHGEKPWRPEVVCCRLEVIDFVNQAVRSIFSNMSKASETAEPERDATCVIALLIFIKNDFSWKNIQII